MIKPISASSGVVYRHAVKPMLFRFQPDAVHERMLRIGAGMERLPLARAAARASLAYHNPMLVQRVVGIDFINPVGLSAGFDKNMVLVPLMKSIGFGFMEGGSITLEPCAGNARPWFHRLPRTKSLVVHVGLANEGTPTIVRRIREYPKQTFRGFPLNISVAKTNSPNACSEADAIDDYAGSLKIIQELNAGNMLTLNISCPNTYGGEPFTTPERLEHLLARVDALQLRKPVFIKMPIDLSWQAFNALLKVADPHNIAGVTIGNLAKDRSKIKLSDPLPDSVEGGLSGRPTFQKKQRTYSTNAPRVRQAFCDHRRRRHFFCRGCLHKNPTGREPRGAYYRHDF